METETLAERQARTFILQRYAAGRWPEVLGHRPFLVTGPRLNRWVVPGSLDKYREYRFTKSLLMDLSMLDEMGPELARDVGAELLLSEGLVQALWSTGPVHLPQKLLWGSWSDSTRRAQEGPLPHSERWGATVAEVSRCLKGGQVSEMTVHFLSTLMSPANAQSYVAEDELALEALIPPSS